MNHTIDPATLTRPLRAVPDARLLAELKALVRNDNRLTAELLMHMGEVDERRLYLGEACSSMFVYCVEVLHMSEPVAYKRIQASRAALRFPVILGHVARGELHLSAVKILAPYLTAENHGALLDASRHATKRRVEELVAERFPAEERPQTIRKLPTPRAGPRAEAGAAGAAPSLFDARAGVASAALAPPPPSPCAPPAEPAPVAAAAPVPAPRTPIVPPVIPVAANRWRLQTTLPAKTYDKLRKAQALLRHQVPDGDVSVILDRALGLLVEDLMKKKFGAGRKPRHRNTANAPAAPSSAVPTDERSRHVPFDTRRAVLARDGLQCTFTSTDGRRCTETALLELDHLRPRARDGGDSVENIAVKCRGHNGHAAELAFGADFMARKRSQSKAGRLSGR